MGQVLISMGGWVISDDCTAKTPQLLEGYTAITNDSDDEIIEGTMPNNGSINGICKIKGEILCHKF